MKQTVLRIVVAARILNEGAAEPIDVVMDAKPTDLMSNIVQHLLEASLPELAPDNTSWHRC